MRNNLNGLTYHEADSTSNKFMLGTQHERSNDATTSATLILTNYLFCQSRAVVNLNHAHVNIDLCYWIYKVLSFILGSGVVSWSTVKRTPWVPLAYEKTEKV